MNLRSHLFCLSAIVIWSSLEITGKLVGVRVDPFTLTAWRFVIGGVILFPFALRQAKLDNIRINRSSILHIGSLGILNVCVSMLLLQLSIFYGKASLSAVIVSMNPLFVSVFALMIINEKLSKPQSFSLLIGLLGLGLIILSERELTSSLYNNLPLAIVLAVAASIIFGFYTVVTKSAVLRYGNILTNSISFIVGGLMLTSMNILLGKPWFFRFTISNLVFMAYLGLVITGFAYLLYFEGMKVLTAARASVYFFLKPVIASLLAYFVLKETLGFWQVLGIVLVVIGLSRNLLSFLGNRILKSRIASV